MGLKMLVSNSCNLLYFVWRIEPEEKLMVTLKRNPGQTLHKECGARGYHHVAGDYFSKYGLTAKDRKTHKLLVKIYEINQVPAYSVWVDQQKIQSGTIDPDLLGGIDGPVGIRSDNGKFTFKLFVSD